MQKDSRFSKGLRATGIGGCICTRHEVVRPLGLVDLLKGERYVFRISYHYLKRLMSSILDTQAWIMFFGRRPMPKTS